MTSVSPKSPIRAVLGCMGGTPRKRRHPPKKKGEHPLGSTPTLGDSPVRPPASRRRGGARRPPGRSSWAAPSSLFFGVSGHPNQVSLLLPLDTNQLSAGPESPLPVSWPEVGARHFRSAGRNGPPARAGSSGSVRLRVSWPEVDVTSGPRGERSPCGTSESLHF